MRTSCSPRPVNSRFSSCPRAFSWNGGRGDFADADLLFDEFRFVALGGLERGLHARVLEQRRGLLSPTGRAGGKPIRSRREDRIIQYCEFCPLARRLRMKPDLIGLGQQIADIFLHRGRRLLGQSGLELVLGAIAVTATEQRHRVVIEKSDIIRFLSRQRREQGKRRGVLPCCTSTQPKVSLSDELSGALRRPSLTSGWPPSDRRRFPPA